MKLNKEKVLFVFNETLLFVIALQQMTTTTGWIYNLFIYLPILNAMLFMVRNEIKDTLLVGKQLFKYLEGGR